MPNEPSSPDRLVVSCLGEGAGLLLREGAGWRRIDDLASTGFAVSPDRRRAARALWTSDDPQTHGELVVYDAVGVQRYLRVDELQEPHGLVWDGDAVVAVSTLRNRLLWIDDAGHVERRAEFPGSGDAWHLNCPAWAGDRLVVTAFGQHERHRDWSHPSRPAGGGVILDVASGEVLQRGFEAPHDPVRLSDGWLICDSRRSRVLRLDEAGAIVAERDLGGWTRGMVVGGDLVHVGVSARRGHGGTGMGSVASLRLDDLALVERVDVPADEIFCLAFVPQTLLAGIEVGFAVNPARMTPLDVGGDLLASGHRGGDREPDLTVAVALPPEPIEPGRYFTLTVTVTSSEPTPVFPVGPEAWTIAARWHRAGGELVDTNARARLDAPLMPGEMQRARLRVQAPQDAGTARLEVALIQELIRWHTRACALVDVVVDEVDGASLASPASPGAAGGV